MPSILLLSWVKKSVKFGPLNDERGHDDVLFSDEMNVGFAAFVGDSRGNLPRLNSRMNTGRVKLTSAGLEAFFTVLSAATTNPMDVIRMGIDLATTLDVQFTQVIIPSSQQMK